MTTIPIYVGTEPSQWLPTQVLKHSILSRTQADVEFIPLDTTIGLPRNQTMTGFSFCRWAVPFVNEYRDRAIYLDADIVVLGDIADLFNASFDAPVAARPVSAAGAPNRFFTSVMVLDCARLKHWDYSAWVKQAVRPQFVDAVMWARSGAPHASDFGVMPSCWNDLDIVKAEPSTKLLHFTSLDRQPWRWERHPQGQVWRDALVAALAARVVTREQVYDEIDKRFVRDSIFTVL